MKSLRLPALLFLALPLGPLAPLFAQDGAPPAPADAADATDDPAADDADAPPEIPPFLSLREGDPDAPRGLRLRTDAATPGYTLVEPLNGRAIHLLDLDGKSVHHWPTDSSPGAWAYLLEDGSLLRCGREDEDPHFKGGGIGGRLQKLAPDGTLLWHYSFATEGHCQHHDLEPLPNGNFLLIAWERKTAGEAVRAGRVRDHVGEAGLWPDMVLELQPVGTDDAKIVWEWHAWDHLVQDLNPDLPNYGPIGEHPGRFDVNFDHRNRAPLTAEELKAAAELEDQMAALGYGGGDDDEDAESEKEKWDKSGDWMHTNAVDYLPDHDLIVLSSPELSEIYVIDHSTTTEEARGSTGGRYGKGGDVLWRWGNPVNHGAGERSDRVLYYQHDPSWTRGPSGDLRLVVFNNGGGREMPEGERGYSQVLELALPFDPKTGFAGTAGQPYAPAEAAWTYEDRDGFYSAFISGAQRLRGGNTLICSGAAGRVFEVNREGTIVWEYYNELGGDVEPPEHAGKAPPLALFRAARYAPDHPGVKAVLGE